MSLNLNNKSKEFSLLSNSKHSAFAYNPKCRETPKGILKGSYTIEAALTFPLFLVALIFVIFIMRIITVETCVQRCLDETSQRLAAISTTENQVSQAMVIAACSGEIIAARMPAKYIHCGILGVNLAKTSVEGNYIDIKASYGVDFPIKILGKYTWRIEQCSRNRKWVGFDPNEDIWDGVYVYVTKSGEVYHEDPSCVYLNPSIRAVDAGNIKNVRNESGGKYSLCSSCKYRKRTSILYVTDYGTAYHKSLNCSSLKRTINKILYKEAQGKYPPCHKCAGGN